jgi:hypothetical protein
MTIPTPFLFGPAMRPGILSSDRLNYISKYTRPTYNSQEGPPKLQNILQERNTV